MRYRNVIVFLGFVVIILQFLGFPQSWDEIFYIAAGVLIIAFGYLEKDKRPSVLPSKEEPAREND